MRFCRVIIFVASLACWSFALGEERHLLAIGSSEQAAVAPEEFCERVKNLAIKYEPYGSVDRVALYDIAVPKDAAEYDSLAGYGVILVAAVSHSMDELPLRRVYVRIADATIELTLLTSASSKTQEGSLVAKVLGAYAWEGLYLFPVYAQAQDADLMLDFATKRSGFIVGHFARDDSEAIRRLPFAPPITSGPSEAALLTFIDREYPGFFRERSGTPESSRESRGGVLTPPSR